MYLFAGGGTGGHIFPALAIWEEMRGRSPDARARFVCSPRPLDGRILEAEGAEYRIVPARPFSARPVPLAKFVLGWGSALRASREVIREARREDGDAHVVAMGGFVAAPMARAAVIERAALTLVNMDAIPGKANRWVARMAVRGGGVVTSAPVEGFDWKRVPPIVRRGAVAGLPAPDCRAAIGLDPAKPTLLVTGASQGARSINRLMIRLVGDRVELLRGWQVIHQTGANEEGPVREAYASAGVPALVEAFFENMGVLWGAADVALSRAGAGSVAEAWANQTPTVFLPYPYHRDQHQRHNARPLEEAGGAVIVTDRIDEMANVREGGPGEVLAGLIRDATRRERMRASLKGLGPADGAQQIARMLLEMK